MIYRAKYVPPKSTGLSCGEFEFESMARKNTKKNIQDARMEMLNMLGKDAVSYSVVDIEKLKD